MGNEVEQVLWQGTWKLSPTIFLNWNLGASLKDKLLACSTPDNAVTDNKRDAIATILKSVIKQFSRDSPLMSDAVETYSQKILGNS